MITSDRHQGERSLRAPGAILLISCYELGHQPIGIARPIGALEQEGYTPASLDIAVEAFDPDRVRHAGFVGISVPMHTALRLGVRVALLVRRINPSCHICFFGLYASLNAEYLLNGSQPPAANTVIGGEYELPLLNLIEFLDQGGDKGKEMPPPEGVSLRGRLTGPHLQRSRSQAPVPARRDLPPLSRYASLAHAGRQHVAGYVEASRGCLHTCLHCPIVPVYEGRFFLVPEDMVLQDIRQQVQAGATHITFGDPDFLNGPGHSLSIVRAMHAEFPHVTFDFTAKIEHLLKRRAIFPELATLGCLFVISAVESFSDYVLAHLNKGHTRADIMTALGIVRQAGIIMRPSLVAFTPWTSLEDYKDLFDLVETHDLIDAIDPVQYSVRLLIPPGSALLDQPDQPAPIRKFLGALDQAGFQYLWTHPDPRMDALHREVTAVVEEAGKAGEDPVLTFDRLRGLAYRAAGRTAPTASRCDRHPSQRPIPRMTEPWFCCAEPTRDQLMILELNR